MSALTLTLVTFAVVGGCLLVASAIAALIDFLSRRSRAATVVVIMLVIGALFAAIYGFYRLNGLS